jgi:hypothetical protein
MGGALALVEPEEGLTPAGSGPTLASRDHADPPSREAFMRAAAAPLLATLLALSAVGCGGDPDAGPDPAAEEGIRVSGFSTPESVLHDEADDVYLVSNIDGGPHDRDGNGFISRVSPAGEVQALRWIDGAAEGVELNAPKGMALLGDRLYVADIDCVRVFDRTTGAPAGEHCPEGATFLNGVAADDDLVYVTDSGIRAGDAGFEPSGTDAVYRIDGDGTITTVAEGVELGAPNGIAFGPRGGFVVTFGSGEIYQLGTTGAAGSSCPASRGACSTGSCSSPTAASCSRAGASRPSSTSDPTAPCGGR